MAQERISRSRKRELEEPDEFITLSSRIAGFASAHAKQVITGFIIVLVMVIAFSGLRYYSIQTEKKAEIKLEKILMELEKARENKNPEEVFKALKPEFENMMVVFPRKKASKAARLLFAGLAFQAEDSSMALKLYEQSLKDYEDEPFFKNLVLKNLANIFEQEKDYAKAISHLEMILNSQNPEMKDEVLFHLARLHGANNMKDQEMDDYKKIIAEFPDSEYAKIANTKIQ
ncbi:MAG: tetratricopeptide repeat protein [Proteobacteria bacterium]|nr:tetratricopeptide repeat protein [Desulfobacteraceae bacterium]MBU4318934.1 tetratricopeptide repeat protein [Pseudomonadota bacterium]MBU4469614.1 tetratricopeptide repeat protein [Pseudomonadota bacterium]MCG2753292.1 tetratricopeptide repeat protein [Desulfobacteraceae bacterium]